VKGKEKKGQKKASTEKSNLQPLVLLEKIQK
jgi:hypothetical protein